MFEFSARSNAKSVSVTESESIEEWNENARIFDSKCPSSSISRLRARRSRDFMYRGVAQARAAANKIPMKALATNSHCARKFLSTRSRVVNDAMRCSWLTEYFPEGSCLY